MVTGITFVNPQKSDGWRRIPLRFAAARVTLAGTLAYDPATNQWSTNAAMPTARTRLGAAVINNQLYAVGGWATNDLARVERCTP